jgi:hypothetical protein
MIVYPGESRQLTVTITGADDGVDPYQLVHLSRFYPFVEWGILSSEKRRGTSRFPVARYPSFHWIRELEQLALSRTMNLSMHLCGAEARLAALQGREFRPHAPWGRVQLNGYEPGTANQHWDALSRGSRGFRFILQARSHETLEAVWRDAQIADADVLFDPSGGAGKGPGSWPIMPIGELGEGSGIVTGFAGGIGPENVEGVLSEIISKNKQLIQVWIDMESGVRSGGDKVGEEKYGMADQSKFDLDKVKAVLEVVRKFREREQAFVDEKLR